MGSELHFYIHMKPGERVETDLHPAAGQRCHSHRSGAAGRRTPGVRRGGSGPGRRDGGNPAVTVLQTGMAGMCWGPCPLPSMN